jgi:DNA-damage-inducible protein J
MVAETSVNSNKIRTNIYLNKSIKNQAQKIFKEYGISLSDAVNMFLRQSVYENGIPFQLKIPKDNIPNDETLNAIKDCEDGVGLEEVTFEELQRDMKRNVS